MKNGTAEQLHVLITINPKDHIQLQILKKNKKKKNYHFFFTNNYDTCYSVVQVLPQNMKAGHRGTPAETSDVSELQEDKPNSIMPAASHKGMFRICTLQYFHSSAKETLRGNNVSNSAP